MSKYKLNLITDDDLVIKNFINPQQHHRAEAQAFSLGGQ
jgi:hypothetical protein